MVFGNAAGDTITVTGTPTFATQLSAALGSASAPAYSFTGDLNTGMYSSGADLLELVTGGTARVQLGASSGTLGSTSYPFFHYGRTDAGTPSTGTVGEIISAVQSTATGLNTVTNQYGDGAEIILTKGEWDVTAGADFSLGSATSSAAVFIGVSTTAGNSASGLTFGTNAYINQGPTSTFDVPLYIPPYRVSISTATTHYLKLKAQFVTGASAGAIVQAAFHIRARRMQ